MLRDWGAEQKYQHVLKGYNYRLEGIQAAVLRVKLRHLENWTERRRANAARYGRLLSEIGIATPEESRGARHVYHVYAIRNRRRSAWQEALLEKKDPDRHPLSNTRSYAAGICRPGP